MTNPHGTPIWYELQARDPDAARDFYQAVVGWSIDAAAPEGSPVDYRMIAAAPGDFAGGLARYEEGVTPPAMQAGWKVYFGVDDVDAAADRITAAGGTVHIAPFDLAGVGRMAFAEDPQGNPFYVMRGFSPEDSTAFGRDATGKCNWNELASRDAVAGGAFYARVFGWTYPRAMPMGEMGDYTFIDCAGQELGAMMTAGMPGQPTGWQVYFRVADVDAAAETVRAKGGAVHMGPMEVPGGERIIVASDPAGTPVGFVSGRAQ